MAYLAARTIPGGLNTMGFQSPDIVVGIGHYFLVTFTAAFFLMAHTACIVQFLTEGTVAAHPVLVVTGGRGFLIHIYMT